MKKLNNKGFAISTILFSILILGTLVFATLYATVPLAVPEPKIDDPIPTTDDCLPFIDFTCPGEFAIGTEHFCPLKTYNGSDTITSNSSDPNVRNQNVVVALAKYYVNANPDLNNISPYGLQYKKAICYDMTARSITSNTTPAAMGYHSILDTVHYPKMKTMINNPSTFNACVRYYDSDGSCRDWSYDLDYLGDTNAGGYDFTSNPLIDLILRYYGNLKEADSSLNNNEYFRIRLVNLRDFDDFNLEQNSNSKFPCYKTLPRTYGDIKVYIRDDRDGDHGSNSSYRCDFNQDNMWVYSPTNNINYEGSTYFTDIMAIESNHTTYALSIGSSAATLDHNYNSHLISREAYSFASTDDEDDENGDFYNDYYFRPVIEVTESYYNAHKVTN